MQHRISLSTNLLIVLAANKRKKSKVKSQPKVIGIKVDSKKVSEVNCGKLQVDCQGKMERIESSLAIA